MSGEIVKTVALKEPLLRAGEEIKELKFRKPKAAHFRNMPFSPTMGDLMDVAGKMCGMLAVEMDELCFDDMMKVAEILGEFMPHTPPIGGKP
jgi:hypothetical protein